MECAVLNDPFLSHCETVTKGRVGLGLSLGKVSVVTYNGTGLCV